MKKLVLVVLFLAAACKKEEAPAPTPPPTTETAAKPAGQTVELTVTEKGFEPSPVKVKAGEPLTLVVTRKTDKTCATELVIDEPPSTTPLPLNEPVKIAFVPKKTGELRYGCAMDKMVAGVLLVE